MTIDAVNQTTVLRPFSRRQHGNFRMINLRFLVLLFGIVAVSGCASRESPIPLNSYQSIATSEPATVKVADSNYRINSLDELRIDVFGEKDLSLERVPVDPNGKFVLPMAGEVVAEGRTTAELSQQIAVALKRYLRNPQVAVNVTQFTSQKVTVEGSVKTPGVFQAMTQMTLMDAIAMGQGLSDDSKNDEILVFRRTGGQRYLARFDIDMIQNGTLADPAILPGDVVVVGYSASRRLFRDSIAVLPAAVGIFLALLN